MVQNSGTYLLQFWNMSVAITITWRFQRVQGRKHSCLFLRACRNDCTFKSSILNMCYHNIIYMGSTAWSENLQIYDSSRVTENLQLYDSIRVIRELTAPWQYQHDQRSLQLCQSIFLHTYILQIIQTLLLQTHKNLQHINQRESEL
jgi:hypothetical protein